MKNLSKLEEIDKWVTLVSIEEVKSSPIGEVTKQIQLLYGKKVI